MEDLGLLSSGTHSEGFDINDSGQVAGYSNGGSSDDHAFLFDPAQDTATDLGTLPGGWYSAALGLNDKG